MTTASPLPVWWDDAADGGTNMAADEALAAEAERRGGLVVRLYAWTPAAVSLGAFQKIADARSIPAIADVPLVRRPSGGGAIVHGSDLTYAAAVPKAHPWGRVPQAFYDALHEAMVAALADRGIAARLHVAAGRPAADDGAFFCFDRRAAGDIVATPPNAAPAPQDPKIMGSAQRRLPGVVLQHGSLLLRASEAVGPVARHAGVLDLRPEIALDVRGLAGAWLERVARSCGCRVVWQTASFRREREAEIAQNAVRFRAEQWTARR